MKSIAFSSEAEIFHSAETFATPFYLYDKKTIERQCKELQECFAWAEDFQNYFAVKATPNPHILKIIKDQGFGVDCSSFAELLLAEATGFSSDGIFFTSNNTTVGDYKKALELGAIINLDDVSHIQLLHENSLLPDHICFRYNPGPSRTGNNIIGNPADAKFGLTKEQLFSGYEQARLLGCSRFSLHTMIISNCLNEDELVENARMMFSLVQELQEKFNIKIYRLNLGGGIGIPYKPEDQPVDISSMSTKIMKLYENSLSKGCFHSFRLSFECGRFITGPAGILITRVINKKTTYKSYLGVDATIANLMRPALYGSYHHITHICRKGLETGDGHLEIREHKSSGQSVYDVVGSLCENNDKLAIDRSFTRDVRIGDLLVFHDCGAHSSAMGFNYNGKLRCAEYLRKYSSELQLIRRAETYSDLFATIVWNGNLCK